MSTGLDVQQKIFAENPEDLRAFEALEEHFFVEGNWEALADAYRLRVTAPSIESDPNQLSPLLFRLGQILEERIVDLSAAAEVFWRLARLDPSNRPALRQLRGIHEQQQQWDMVLQIAELEGATEMQPYERAEFEAQLGSYWLDHLGDPSEAQLAFERSLAADPDYPPALEGLAAHYVAAGRHAEAAELLERLTVRLRGPERAKFWVMLGTLRAGPLEDVPRAAECFERALDDDPFCIAAVEWLLLLETAAEQWETVAELLETRFDLAAGARHRAAIAVEASQIQLTHLGSIAAARAWVERASELAEDEISVLLAAADVDRAEGNGKNLLETLAQLISVGGSGIPQSALIQAAELYADLGRCDEALDALGLASEKQSGNDLELLTLQVRVLREKGAKRELAEALETLTALESSEDPVRQAHFLRELARLQESDLSDEEAAQTAWQRAFDLDPQSDESLDALECHHRKANDWDSLRSVLETALDARGIAGQARLSATLGQLLLEHHDDASGARACFDAAIADDDTCRTALAGLHQLATDGGDNDLLLEVCEQQAAHCENASETEALARQCVAILKERRAFEPALKWTRRWFESSPKAREALEWSAEFEAELGLSEEEIETLGRLAGLQTGSDRVETLRRKAHLHLELENVQAAAATLESALEVAPEDTATLARLAEVYRTLGRAEDLAPCLRRWADSVSAEEQTPILEELACLLHDPLGDLDAAIVVRWQLAQHPNASQESALELEALLELAGRYTEMAQLLDSRREALGDDSAEAFDLDVRRGRLRLEELGQCEEAVEIFTRLHERHPQDDSILNDLERALRAGEDVQGLCDLLERKAGWESDSDRRLAMEFERAMLLDEALGEPLAACDLYEKIAREEAGSDHASFALARLETLLESHGHWSRLRELLTSQTESAEPDEKATLHERIAQICRERLGDLSGCADHLEAVARFATNRVHVWQELEALYRHDLDRPADWLRVVEAELETQPEAEREYALRVNAARLFLDNDKRPVDRDAAEAVVHYERVFDLDPTQSEAAEALASHYLRVSDYEEALRVLEMRLEHMDAADVLSRSDLRLRIAELLADRLDRPVPAQAHFEAAREVLGVVARIAEPLAQIYQEGGDFAAQAKLAQEVLDSGEPGLQSPLWRIRLADSQRSLGLLDEAALAYRAALLATPDNRDVEDALIEIYSAQDEFEPLAELLEKRLPYADLEETIDLRMRLARLHADGLDAPNEALAQLDEILETHPQHLDAAAFAMEVAERVGDPTRLVELLDRCLATERPPAERAALLEKRGRLITDRLGNPELALPCLREAIALMPECTSARNALRETLEGLERWPAVLDCLFLEAGDAEGDERVELLERATQIAWDHLSPDAALPWVARLREVRPDDPRLLERLGEIHRRAGRFEAALTALDEEICMRPNEEDACRLYVARAGLLERELNSPGRAVVSYQHALSCATTEEKREPILVELDRLYSQTDRPVERAAILEERVSGLSASDGIGLRQVLATLYCADLAKPDRAIEPLMLNVEATAHDPAIQMGHLGALDAALHASSRPDAWAQVAERELELIDEHREIRDSTPVDYQRFLREELARIYDVELGNPDRAILHYRRIVDDLVDADETELRLLDLLRRCGQTTELATRLASHLERVGGRPTEWIELGLLREERLLDLAGAMAAYREALAGDPSSLDAIRGLRRCSERLRDSESLCDALAAEVEQSNQLTPSQRAAAARKLGEVRWTQLRASEPAAAAYERALELEPNDLIALRALTRVREAGDDQEATQALYRREIEILGEERSNRNRAHEVWLRLADALHRDPDARRECLDALIAASKIERLSAERELRRARLHESLGEPDAFAQVFGAWCDRDDSTAGVGEHVELALHLAEVGESRAARERAKEATLAHPSQPEAWICLARLERDALNLDTAADAFEKAAEVADVRIGAEYCVEAAACLDGRDAERAWALLDRAASLDAASFEARAALTRKAAELGRDEDTLVHALRVFDMSESEQLAVHDRIELALFGARAACRIEESEAARRLFAIAVSCDSDQVEALEGLAQIDFANGDFRAARTSLEHRITLPGEQPRRGVHLGMIARGLEADGLFDAAWTQYEEAIAADPDLEEAHEGLVRVHERSARPDEALDSLERWADSDGDPEIRASAAFRAGEHALAIDDKDRAQRNLESATRLDPQLAPAWQLLCEVVALQGPASSARAVCDVALESIEPGAYSSTISLQSAKLAEVAGDNELARTRYADAIRWNPRCSEAALAASRLDRMAGDWLEADRVLAEFIEAHPDPESRSLAHVHLERGRLLSGPLEGFDEAIEAYDRALALQPEMHVARTALAGLLLHRPDRTDDALNLHREILAASPTNATSLRAVAQIADRLQKPDLAAGALSILHALGQDAPREIADTQRGLQFPIQAGPPMLDPSAERLRRLAHVLREELGEVLAEVERPAFTSEDSDVMATLAQIQEIESELAAPGLTALDADQRESLFSTIVGLFLDVGGNGGDSPYRDAIDRALGRWTRRKIRRIAEETSIAEIAALDHEAWGIELRTMSAAQALDRNGGDLTRVLHALLILEAPEGDRPALDDAELGTLVATSESASGLLTHITDLICERLASRRSFAMPR